jgi:hypothetical protein
MSYVTQLPQGYSKKALQSSLYALKSCKDYLVRVHPQLSFLFSESDEVEWSKQQIQWTISNDVAAIIHTPTKTKLEFFDSAPDEICGVPSHNGLLFATMRQMETSRITAIYLVLISNR